MLIAKIMAKIEDKRWYYVGCEGFMTRIDTDWFESNRIEGDSNGDSQSSIEDMEASWTIRG